MQPQKLLLQTSLSKTHKPTTKTPSFLMIRWNSCVSVYAHCLLFCHWTPLNTVHLLCTLQSDIYKHWYGLPEPFLQAPTSIKEMIRHTGWSASNSFLVTEPQKRSKLALPLLNQENPTQTLGIYVPEIHTIWTQITHSCKNCMGIGERVIK